MRDPNFVGPLSKKKVKRHKFYMMVHDRVNRKKFNWWTTEIGSIPLYNPPKNGWVTPVAKELGAGPSLFLMSMKAFCWLFFFFFIINVPLMIFYQGAGTNPEE